MGDVDAQHLSAKLCLRQRSCAVTAAEIQHLHPLVDAELLHERFAALAHRRRDPGEIAFFPKCLVWIHAESRREKGEFRKSKRPLVELTAAARKNLDERAI